MTAAPRAPRPTASPSRRRTGRRRWSTASPSRLGRERLGIVGESGSGKSVIARSIVRLIRPPGRVIAGAVCFEGDDLAAPAGARHARLRGHGVAMVLQDPMS